MAACPIEGHPEMYGLGIRIAFYTHWLGDILITNLGDVSPIAQTSTLVLSVSITVALIIQCADQALEPAEIYVLLLLASGMYFPLIPVYILNLVSCCHPHWDARCWINKKTIAAWIKIAMFVEAIVISAVGLWFWATFVPGWESLGCVGYGFFFSAVLMNNNAFVVFNALLCAGFITACLVLVLEVFGCLGRNWKRTRKRNKKRGYDAKLSVCAALTESKQQRGSSVVEAVISALRNCHISHNHCRHRNIDQLQQDVQRQRLDDCRTAIPLDS